MRFAHYWQDIENDYNLFKGKTKQYIHISSASAYQKEENELMDRIIEEYRK